MLETGRNGESMQFKLADNTFLKLMMFYQSSRYIVESSNGVYC